VAIKSPTTSVHRSHEISSTLSVEYLKYNATIEEIRRSPLRTFTVLDEFHDAKHARPSCLLFTAQFATYCSLQTSPQAIFLKERLQEQIWKNLADSTYKQLNALQKEES
jgi:hypothetical protein